MLYCPNCNKLVDTYKELERIDIYHTRIIFYCDECGRFLKQTDLGEETF